MGVGLREYESNLIHNKHFKLNPASQSSTSRMISQKRGSQKRTRIVPLILDEMPRESNMIL
jgi:hypothetical protein